MSSDSRPSKRLQMPIEDIETEGDRQLKVLLKRQLDTQYSLNDHLSRKKLFTESAVYKPLGEEVSGSRTLGDFQRTEERSRKLEQLRQYGLSEDEIQTKLQADADKKHGSSGRYGQDPAVHAATLDEINRKITTKQNSLLQPDTFSGAKVMSRHEMELEMAITHDKEKAKMLGSLVIEQSVTDPSYQDEKHPINHLDSVLDDAIAKRRRADEKRWRNKVVATCAPKPEGWLGSDEDQCEDKSNCGKELQIGEEIQCQCEQTSSDAKSSLNGQACNKCNNSTFHEGKSTVISTLSMLRNCNTPIVNSNKSEKNDSVTIINKQKTESPNADGPRKLSGNVEPIPKDVILKYKLSMDKIKILERFKNYDAGTPSKTLFLKNLSPKVTETDLVSLFMCYQVDDSPQLIFRLMTGRMKGQAFVTFPSIEVAKEALELVNGYQLKGKPVIISYGKQSS